VTIATFPLCYADLTGRSESVGTPRTVGDLGG
jgi:hypothetical protein